MPERLLVIPGTLPGLNEYIAAERTNRYKAAVMKREAESLVLWPRNNASGAGRLAGRCAWNTRGWSATDAGTRATRELR